MCRVAQEGDSTVVAYPPWERVAVYNLPVHEGRGLFYDGLAYRVPAFDDFVHVFQLSWEGP